MGRAGRRLFAFALLAFLPAAASADPNANSLIHLFNDACIQNMGRPDATRAWAATQRFRVLTHPSVLRLFVGDNPRGKGVAWEVPSLTTARFALSLRGSTEACTVYAERADVKAVESMFLQEVQGAKRPGIDVRKDVEKVSKGHFGLVKQLIYIVTTTGNVDKGYEFIFTTAERPGGPYQVSVQIVAALLH